MLKNLMGSARAAVLVALACAACLMIALVSSSTPAQAAGGTYRFADLKASPDVTCPAGQCFTDVTSSSGFYSYVNNLYIDGIIGGYACGGAGEPCDAQNRPYYRPTADVTRQQMAKFADLGRRNIADAVGLRLSLANTSNIPLVISTTTTDALDAASSSGAEAVQSLCTRASQNCWAFYSSAVTGDYASVMGGGRGNSFTASDDTYPGANIRSNGATAYGADIQGNNYRSLLVTNTQNWYGIYVDTGTSNFGGYIAGDLVVVGDLSVTSCTGCLSASIIQNVDGSNLQAGDVVSIVGSTAPVDGNSPVITVKKANSAYDTGVVGVIGQAMYVPDAQTRAAYQAEQQAIKAANAQRADGMATGKSAGDASGAKFDPGTVSAPLATINDAQGTVHVDRTTTQIATNGYAQVLTAGSYGGLKVDASFGAIKPGDLLVASPNAGYAMKATDRAQANGAVIGKALGSLDSGTGTIAVMITLK